MHNSKGAIVRILEITLRNYKNIVNGTIMAANISNVDNKMPDIRGIYGQNGSGKTAIISAMGLIKKVLIGRPLPADINEYIMYGKDETEIEVLFYIITDAKKYKAKYNIIISQKVGEFYIKEESLYYWERLEKDDSWNKQKGLIINKSHKNHILPKYRNEEIAEFYDEESDFVVSKKMRLKAHESFIFSDEFVNLIKKNLSKVGEEYEILDILRDYALFNLFVVDNQQLALSDANILLPVNFKNYKGDKDMAMGVMPIGLEQPSYLPRKAINEIKTSLSSSNMVLNEIIPGLTIRLRELSVQISKTGSEEVLVELLSCREGDEIPIRYESDGIKKIVAVLHLLIAMFNYNSMTVFIDELDAGIFEYLLGEILEIIEERGKGQLIFTSHNLRPLEVLNKNNLIFTTTNTNNRYIKLKNVKANNNLRDMYYRDLILDGQKEPIYSKTNSAKIARAFRKAGGQQ